MQQLLSRFEEPEPLFLRFLNSVSERRSEDPGEYYATPSDLQAWLEKQQLTTAVMVDESYRLRALELRDALYRIGASIPAGTAPSDEDIEVFNGELCEALAKLEYREGQLSTTESDPLERALQLIALSAAHLFTGDLKRNLKECSSPTCGWLFIDRSKNHTRRWCDMSDCGNRAKAKRYQERHRSGAKGSR